MLEHVKVWNEWNKTKDNPFFGKADMSQIALIGHSRGGEAVTVAAAYNKLPASRKTATSNSTTTLVSVPSFRLRVLTGNTSLRDT